MKSLYRLWPVLLLAAVAAPGVYAQEMGAPPPKSAQERLAEEDPELARYIEVTSPGTEHNFLRRLVGVWSVRARFWGGKDEEMLEGGGRSVNRMILGGRFLQSTFRGEVEGGSLVGLGYDGYDKLRDEYVSVWFDNQNTTIRHYEGKAAEDEKSIMMTSSQINPDSGKTIAVRNRTTIVDARTYRYEQWAKEEGGEEFMSMELVFTREADDD